MPYVDIILSLKQTGSSLHEQLLRVHQDDITLSQVGKMI